MFNGVELRTWHKHFTSKEVVQPSSVWQNGDDTARGGHVTFYEQLGRELRARDIRLLEGGLKRAQVVLGRGTTGGYLGFYTLGKHAAWWGPYTHVCAKMQAACEGRPWLTWALVLHDGSMGGFVVAADVFARHPRHWSRLSVGTVEEHFSLKPADLTESGADEFGGPKTCAAALGKLLDKSPVGPDDVTLAVFE